jgi:secreted protein with Ig-like and vWFA domain
MTSGLWPDHPATPNQQQLAFNATGKRTRPTQAEVIAALLREKRAMGKPLELTEILATGIAQFGARILELRRRGFGIENELERAADGRVLSRYWLECDPERDGQP